MFNKTILLDAGRTRTEYIPYEKTVIEKRAPTDDSIRIYEEIKEKAYNSILSTVTTKGNNIDFKAIIFRNLESYGMTCKYVVTLNGLEIKGEFKVDDHTSKQDIIRNIYTELSKSLAKEFIKGGNIENLHIF